MTSRRHWLSRPVHAAEALCISNDDCKPLIRALTIALFSVSAVPALVARTEGMRSARHPMSRKDQYENAASRAVFDRSAS
jgi:hypothetical protein